MIEQEGYIFLVEDNPDDIELTKRALTANKIANKVVVARNGKEAIDFLFNRGKLEGQVMEEYPTVILLDIKMPKVDGLEVLQKLRSDERTKLLPVTVLTSSNEEQDVIDSYNLGANSYVRKPVDFKQFAAAVKTLGLYWVLFNEPLPPSRLKEDV